MRRKNKIQKPVLFSTDFAVTIHHRLNLKIFDHALCDDYLTAVPLRYCLIVPTAEKTLSKHQTSINARSKR